MSRLSIKVKDGIRSEAREARDAAGEIRDFAKNYAWKKKIRGLFKKDKIVWWIAATVAIALIVMFVIFHKKIVRAFEPLKKDVEDSSAPYWLIPIAVLTILSVPPLFGHEVVLLIVGLLWGLWKGFGIASAGTVIGEGMTFYLFKYFLTEKAKKIEEENVIYGCVARLLREGGIYIMTMVRLSIVPGHLVTSISSTIGVPFWIYIFAIIVTLPKQLVVVYLGVIFEDTGSGKPSSHERLVSYIVYTVTAISTLLSAYIIYTRARKYYPDVKREWNERQLENGKPRSNMSTEMESEEEERLELRSQRTRTDVYNNDFASEVTLHPSMNDENETGGNGKFAGHIRSDSEELLMKGRPSEDGFVVGGRGQGYRDPPQEGGLGMAVGVQYNPSREKEESSPVEVSDPHLAGESYGNGGIQ